MILNEGSFYKIREKRQQNGEEACLISDFSSESDSEPFKKYEKKLYKIPTVKNSQLGTIFKEISVEYYTKFFLILSLTTIVLFVWIFWIDTPPSNHVQGDPMINRCDGINCQAETCDRVKRFEVTGNLCMDLCHTNSVKLPKCSNHLSYFSNSSYQFYSIQDSEINFVCLPSSKAHVTQQLTEGMTMDNFRLLVYHKILANINEPNTVERIVEKIFMFTDVNHDLKLSLAEAQTLWSMLNQKHSYYMLTMTGKSYVPRIVDFCGSVLQIEEVKNHLYESNNYSLLKSVFLSNNNWIKIKPNHKLKIALGILEFFLDTISHNPNNDFGPESIYLCSSIEASFGFTFINEAKLIKYDYILSGRELENRLNDRECSSDADCFYSDECTTTCDLNSHKCTHQLNSLQIRVFCEFFQRFIDSHSELKAEFDPVIKRCLKLKPFYLSKEENFEQNIIPFELDEKVKFLRKRAYWNASMEYTLTAKSLNDKIWEKIKLVNDPVKAKKTTRKPSAGSNVLKNRI